VVGPQPAQPYRTSFLAVTLAMTLLAYRPLAGRARDGVYAMLGGLLAHQPGGGVRRGFGASAAGVGLGASAGGSQPNPDGRVG
jgi:hypothetical protein